MKDIYARVGTVLSHLLAASTVHGPAKQECERLITELMGTDASVDTAVQQRVTAAMDELSGRVAALEQGQDRVRSAVFSGAGQKALLDACGADTAAAEALKGLFNGADPAKFDHDQDGAAGGRAPNPPTDNPDEMTIAQAKAWLDEHGVDHAGLTKVADLRQLVKASMPAGEAAPQTLTAGGGNDTVTPVEG